MATIVIVAGRADERAALAARLAGAGHRVLDASDVSGALTVAKTEPLDLVVAALPTEAERSELVVGLRAELPAVAVPVLFSMEPDGLLPALELLSGVARGAFPAVPVPGAAGNASCCGGTSGRRLVAGALRHRLVALTELNHALAAERDFRALLACSCQVARELLDAECAVLGVLEDDGTAFRHVLMSGCDLEAGDGDCRTIVNPEGPLGRVLAEGGTICVPASKEAPGEVSGPRDRSGPFLGIGLDRPGRRYGVLGFVGKWDALRFDEDDEALAGALAAQIALACENARQAEELDRLGSQAGAAAAEHGRIETALRRREDQFRQLAESVHDVFWLYDLDSERTLYVSPAYEEIWGRPCASLYSDDMAWTEAIHPEDRPRILASLRDRIRSGEYREEYRIVRPDGTERWIRARTFLVRSDPGEPRRLGGVAEDISERKQAEVALERYADRLANLRAMDRAILEARHPREVAEAAVRYLRRLVACWHVNIWLFDFPAGMAEVLTSEGGASGSFPAGLRVPLATYDLGDLDRLRRGESFAVEDVLERSAPAEALEWLRAGGVRAYFRTPLASEGQLIGSVSLNWDRPGGLAAEDVEVVHEMADQLAVAIRHALLFDEVRSGRERLQTLSRQLLKVQEEERRHMARELHDEIGQSLTVAKINLQHAMARDDKSSASSSYLEETSGLIDRVLSQVRDLSLDLRPSVLDDLGLVAALRWYLDRLCRRAGFTGRLAAEPAEVRVAPDIETACFRIAQEALTNVARHAGARHVQIELRKRIADLELVIRDDGRGFDVSAARQRAERGASLGLLGMQERVELLGGRIEIDSSPDRGTEIRAWLPLAAPEGAVAAEGGEG